MSVRLSVLSRRAFVAGAVAVPVLAGSGLSVVRKAGAWTGDAVLLHDGELAAGQRFAAHARHMGGHSLALEGDRIRLLRDVLRAAPSVLYGVSRYSDQLLAVDVAREAGYRPLALVQHRADGGVVPRCQPAGAAIGAAASLVGADGRWPEAFAELALGGAEQCASPQYAPPQHASPQNNAKTPPAMSWVIARR